MPHPDFQKRLDRIEGLIRSIENLEDSAGRDLARELLQVVLDLHGKTLARILELVRQTGEHGKDLLDRLRNDALVASALLVHGLHPVDLETRLHKALDYLHPHLLLHGADLEVVSWSQDLVRLRLQGKTTVHESLKQEMDEAFLREIPDVALVEIETTLDPGPNKISLPVVAAK